MYDAQGTPYLDLQMWYSAVNFGYKNKRLEQKMIEQLQTLPTSGRAFQSFMTLMPGVAAALDALSGRDDVLQALGTGNFRRGGELKLRHYGIDHHFPDMPGGRSDRNR